ncbi:hypothetical protein THII_0916 [Thioploca ingrica]|uniref:Uncharacterized protein n=1 Tax=Thioploca ingrica TaxID=40754 RepID=A0A090AC00_9GAMM|nr:hypothetical protein THII_0916 [Thioploca ingrica]
MKNLLFQFKFSLLTQRHWFVSLARSCGLIALIMIALPVYSAQWIKSSNHKCDYNEPVKAGSLVCLCLKITESELPKELADSNTPIRYKWFQYIGTKPYFEENQKPSKEKLNEQSWQLCKEKDNIQIGLWQIDAVYENNEPVKCGNQDCHYSIRVE